MSTVLAVPGLVNADAIDAAAETLRGVAVRTPLLSAAWLQDRLGSQVFLKCENLQRTGSFKIRGAYNMISRFSAEQRAGGVITYSSGNHGQAVALAARIFGVPAVVVMPVTAPPVKVEGARRLGAEVVLEGTTSTERHRKALEIAAERGLAVVPPFDHPDIIAGQGTIGREIMEDAPRTRVILVPVGGGGMLSGVSAYIRQRASDCIVIGVEPANADAMQQSMVAGEPVTITARPTIADGLMPVRPGDLTFAHARAFADRIVTVSEEAIADATRALLSQGKLVVEFSGAVTVAALLSGVFDPEGRPAVAVLSGGNLDPARALQLLG